MREFLNDILIEPFRENEWFGLIMGIFMWILSIAIVGGGLCLIIWLIDSSNLSIKQKEGVIVEHYYIPEHTTTTYIMNGKIYIPVTNYIPAYYGITIEIDGLKDNVTLNKDFWRGVSIGDRICCQYTNGRLFKTLYIKSFCNE